MGRLGHKYCLTIISLSFIFSACELNEKDTEINISPQDTTATVIKFLALGDSYTEGTGIEANGNWPNQLVRRLRSKEFVVDTLSIIAQSGQTSGNLLNAIRNTEIGDFNLVSLQIGVNNQFLGRPFETFETEFNQLLDSAIDFSGSNHQVFVLSIPDYGVTPFGASESETIAQEIDQYNAYIKTVCEQRKILYIDVTSISRELGDGSLALAPDDLHPSAYQYSKWVDAMIPDVIKLVEKLE